MRSKLYIVFLFLGVTFYGNSQDWATELQTHMHKPIAEIGLEMDRYFNTIGKTRANKYHKYLRWFDYASNHQNEEGKLFNHTDKNQHLLKKMNAQIEKYNSPLNTSTRHYHGGWSSINPDNFFPPNMMSKPTMGRINCIAKPSPTSTIIYAGTATGGVWKSYDNGGSWEPLWDGMIQTGVSSIVIDYTNPNHILALSGDGDSVFIPSSGVFHSYDAGSTWTQAYAMETNDLNYGLKMIQSKTIPDEYFICRRWNNLLKVNISNGDGSLFSSFSNVFDIEYQTNEDDILWASSSVGIFKKDGNDPWEEINHPNLPTETVTRSAIAMAPSNENVIYYAVASTNLDFYGLYKSPDKGETWEIMYDTTKTNFMTYQCGYNFTLDVDPTFENRVYIGTGYLHGSYIENGEMQFEEIRDHIHADIHNAYHIGDKHYVCTDGGISVRYPGSQIYYSINNGLVCTQFYDLDVYGTSIVAGAQDNGTMFWDIGDATGYRRLASDGFDCMIDPSNPNIVYSSTQDEKFRSTDGGITNTSIMNAEWHDPMAFAVDNPNKVLIHSIDELKVSYDSGLTFPDSFDVFSDSLSVNSISQCEEDPNVLYLLKSDSLARTENFNANPASVTWAINNLGNDATLRGILVHPDSCDVLFIVRSGYHNTQIAKSTDGGLTNENYSQGISQLPVYCIYYDHVNGNGYYIGTELGVYYRNSTMDEWIPFSTYLPRVPVYDLKINNNYIYAATYGRGVWRSPRYRTCSSSLLLLQANDPTFGASSGLQIHKASNSIVSNRIIRGKEGTNVLYQAGNYIDLLEGFHAKSNNLFTAKAAGCLE